MGSTTSNLTRFFRNPGHFKALEHVIVPDIAARKGRAGSRGMKLWSVGCSTGEEPLSLAMLLLETLPEGCVPQIVAIDRDPRAVDRARRGIYRDAQIDGVPRRLRARYFERCAEGFRPAEELRRLIRFECRAVEDAEEAEAYDIVVCRNLLTYAGNTGQRTIAARLWHAMASYSYLLIGGSETLLGVDGRFEYLSTDWSVVYRKRGEAGGSYESAPAPSA